GRWRGHLLPRRSRAAADAALLRHRAHRLHRAVPALRAHATPTLVDARLRRLVDRDAGDARPAHRRTLPRCRRIRPGPGGNRGHLGSLPPDRRGGRRVLPRQRLDPRLPPLPARRHARLDEPGGHGHLHDRARTDRVGRAPLAHEAGFAMTDAVKPVRVDSWLWAIRIYKTRSAATTACRAGHVRVNGEKTKAAQTVKPGDEVRVRIAG